MHWSKMEHRCNGQQQVESLLPYTQWAGGPLLFFSASRDWHVDCSVRFPTRALVPSCVSCKMLRTTTWCSHAPRCLDSNKEATAMPAQSNTYYSRLTLSTPCKTSFSQSISATAALGLLLCGLLTAGCGGVTQLGTDDLTTTGGVSVNQQPPPNAAGGITGGINGSGTSSASTSPAGGIMRVGGITPVVTGGVATNPPDQTCYECIPCGCLPPGYTCDEWCYIDASIADNDSGTDADAGL